MKSEWARLLIDRYLHLVELLNLMPPNRPSVHELALSIITRIANNSEENKLAMVEAWVLESITKYLTIGP
jgi:hypothetical protein